MASSIADDSSIDPRIATAAQIPLSSFSLPKFPPEAAALKALTLTADIKVDEYASLLTNNFDPVPPLPIGIEALTLELFSLGYPDGFLNELSKRLPALRSLVLYSQLFGGLTAATQADALRFVQTVAGSLRALHLLDVFAQSGFVRAAGIKLAAEQNEHRKNTQSGGLLFLEINYTNQPTDDSFIDRLLPEELPAFVVPTLITCAFNIAPATKTEDPQDPTNLDEQGELVERAQQGVKVFSKSFAPELLRSLTEDDTAPTSLKMLNCTLYTLDLAQLGKLLEKHTNLAVLNATLEQPNGDCWKDDLTKILITSPHLEQIELVVSPGENADAASNTNYLVSKEDLGKLSNHLTKLSSFKLNTLRRDALPSVSWEKEEGGTWREA